MGNTREALSLAAQNAARVLGRTQEPDADDLDSVLSWLLAAQSRAGVGMYAVVRSGGVA